MVLCRFFARGYCRFGEKCRYEHTDGGGGDQQYRNRRNDDDGNQWENSPVYSPPSYKATHYNKNTANVFGGGREQKSFSGFQEKGTELLRVVIQDVESWEYGHQWLFTCYAPVKEGKNFPEFNDISPEELRWNAYQAKEYGTFEDYKRKFAELSSSVTTKIQQLKSPTPLIVELLNKVAFPSKTSENTQSFPQNTFPKTSSSSQPFSQQSTFSFKFSGSTNPTSNFSFSSNPNEFTTEMMQTAIIEETEKSSTGFSKNFFGGTVSAPPTTTNVFNQNNQLNQQWGTGFLPSSSSLSKPADKPTIETFSFKPAQTTNFFGNQSIENKSASKFGVTEGQSTIYSNLDSLTENEKREFLAGAFTRGSIPEKPPPREFCI